MLIKYSLKNSYMKAMFTLTIFGILLFEGRLILGPTHGAPGSERVNVARVKQSSFIRYEESFNIFK